MQTSPFARIAQQAFPVADPAPPAVELTERPRTPSRPARSASPSAPPLPRPGNSNRTPAIPAASVAVDIRHPIPGARLVNGQLTIPRASANGPTRTYFRHEYEERPSVPPPYGFTRATRLFKCCTCALITVFLLAFAATVAIVAVIIKRGGKVGIAPGGGFLGQSGR